MPKIFYVQLTVGNNEFFGEGKTRQAARHNAAMKALQALQNEPLPEKSSQVQSPAHLAAPALYTPSQVDEKAGKCISKHRRISSCRKEDESGRLLGLASQVPRLPCEARVSRQDDLAFETLGPPMWFVLRQLRVSECVQG